MCGKIISALTTLIILNTATPGGWGGGTGLLISPMWSYQVLPLDHLPRSAFELHLHLHLLPSQSSLWLLWWYGCPPKLFPWRWHTALCLGWLQHPPQRSCAHLNSLTSPPHLNTHSPHIHQPTRPGINSTLSWQDRVASRHSPLPHSLCLNTMLSLFLSP